MISSSATIVGLLHFQKVAPLRDVFRNPYPFKFTFEEYLADNQARLGYGWGFLRVVYHQLEIPEVPVLSTSHPLCFNFFPQDNINFPYLQKTSLQDLSLPDGEVYSNPRLFGPVVGLSERKISALEKKLAQEEQKFLNLEENRVLVGEYLRKALAKRENWEEDWERDSQIKDLIERLLSLPPAEKNNCYSLKRLIRS